MEYTFKNIQLSETGKIWLNAIYTEIHFDLTGYNVLKYKNAHELKDKLRENINVLTQKKPKN
jgi:hypothetical protein